MSKINYTKVEEFLLSAQAKQQREQLLQEAHAARMAKLSQGQGASGKSAEEAERALKQQQEKDHALVLRFKILQQRLRWFFKQDPQCYTHLGVSKEAIVHYLDSKPENLSPEDWKMIEKLYKRCLEKKTEIEAIGGVTTDEKLIKQARRKQKKKPFRFNKNDKWLST